MTLQGALEEMVREFEAVGFEQPQFEARQLAQECLNIPFSKLMSQPDRELDGESLRRLREWSRRRRDGLPLAYLSQHKGFYKYDFYVESGVLVPRPETELVVETALRRVEERGGCHTIVDLGCGSGCIGLSLISELTEARLWAVDLSAKACEVTWRNAVLLEVGDRVKVENMRIEDWMPGLKFDLVVANPPYVADLDPRVDEHVRRHEPPEALFAGESGLAEIEKWTVWAARHVRSGGLFVCEIGADQSRPAQDFFVQSGFDQIQVERDLAGHDRVVSGVRAGIKAKVDSHG